jgi:DNA-binding NarL/FixJ family response regulator
MGSRVVIADDVSELRRLLARTLDAHDDFEIVGQAADGHEAIARCRDLHPDILILDINMPVMSGFEALPDLRDVLPKGLIVVFSGFDANRAEPRALELGADAYVEKGTPGAELVERLRTLVEGRAR